MNRIITPGKAMAACAMIPLAAFCAPAAAETGTASFAASPIRPAMTSSARPASIAAGSLSATPRSAASGYAQKPSIARITLKAPSSFRMAIRTSSLQGTACSKAACGSQRTEVLPEGFEAERLKRTVEIFAGDVDLGHAPSHLSARMGYIRQGKNMAEPTRRGALALCDRHIDNCRPEINPHEMQLNPIAKELIFNRNRAGKSFDEHVGLKLTYLFR